MRCLGGHSGDTGPRLTGRSPRPSSSTPPLGRPPRVLCPHQARPRRARARLPPSLSSIFTIHSPATLDVMPRAADGSMVGFSMTATADRRRAGARLGVNRVGTGGAGDKKGRGALFSSSSRAGRGGAYLAPPGRRAPLAACTPPPHAPGMMLGWARQACGRPRGAPARRGWPRAPPPFCVSLPSVFPSPFARRRRAQGRDRPGAGAAQAEGRAGRRQGCRLGSRTAGQAAGGQEHCRGRGGGGARGREKESERQRVKRARERSTDDSLSQPLSLLLSLSSLSRAASTQQARGGQTKHTKQSK